MTYLLMWYRYLGPNFKWEWRAALPIGIFIIFLLFKVCEPAYRIVGLVFQVVGVGSVFWGVRTTRKEFGQIGGLDLLIQRAKSFPKRPRDVILFPGAGTMSMSSGRATLTISKGFPEGSSVEEKLSLLLSRLDESEQKINKIQGEIAQTKNELERQVGKEISDRKDDVAQVKKKLEKIATGGLSLTVAGTVWIMVGLIMSVV